MSRKPDLTVPLNLFVYGEGTIGKTTTLEMLYQNMTGKSPKSARLIDTYKGKRFCLCTAGDSRGIIERNVAFMKKNGPFDIFISAVNAKFDSYDAAQYYFQEIMEGYVSSKYSLWVEKLNPKVLESNYKAEDNPASQKTSIADADRLKKIIDFYIDNKLI